MPTKSEKVLKQEFIKVLQKYLNDGERLHTKGGLCYWTMNNIDSDEYFHRNVTYSLIENIRQAGGFISVSFGWNDQRKNFAKDVIELLSIRGVQIEINHLYDRSLATVSISKFSRKSDRLTFEKKLARIRKLY